MNHAKNNSVFDITKIILAIMIVCTHIPILQNILYPWLRLAVPLFFIFSSYFLFQKLNGAGDFASEKKILINYLKRNALLYLFWFIVQFPIIWKIRERMWGGNLLTGILRFFRSLIFSSTFIGSWYISATIIATVIIFYVSKKLSNTQLLAISFVIYMIVCVRSGYAFMFSHGSIIRSIFMAYDTVFTPSYNSFPYAMFWIVCGKCFAEGTFKWSHKLNIGILVVSAVLLEIEWIMHAYLTHVLTRDCYFLLVPACISLFYAIINIPEKQYNNSHILRHCSTITYASHASIIRVLEHCAHQIGVNNNFAILGATLVLCFILSFCILKLKDKKVLRFLKYSY